MHVQHGAPGRCRQIKPVMCCMCQQLDAVRDRWPVCTLIDCGMSRMVETKTAQKRPQDQHKQGTSQGTWGIEGCKSACRRGLVWCRVTKGEQAGMLRLIGRSVALWPDSATSLTAPSLPGYFVSQRLGKSWLWTSKKCNLTTPDTAESHLASVQVLFRLGRSPNPQPNAVPKNIMGLCLSAALSRLQQRLAPGKLKWLRAAGTVDAVLPHMHRLNWLSRLPSRLSLD